MHNSFVTAIFLLITFNLMSADKTPISNEDGTYTCQVGNELNEFIKKCVECPFTINKQISCSTNSECILTCSIDIDTTLMTIVDHSWIYKYNTSTNSNVKLANGQFKDDVKNQIYTATLNLTTYNSGSYGCLFEYKNNDVISKVVGGFKVSQDGAVPYGETCEKSNQCLTLNAECIQTTEEKSQCACPENFPVQNTDENKNVTACFQYSEMGGNCNTVEECEEGGGNATCKNNKCECFDLIRDVNGVLMCLTMSGMHEFCYLDEQCSRYKHAECISNMCDCPPAYAFTENQCKLSVASVIFIIVMSLCCLLTLLAIVVCCCKKNRGWPTWIMYIMEAKKPEHHLINEEKVSSIDI